MNIVFKKILGDPQAKTIKRLTRRVKFINDLSDKYKRLSDKQLKEQMMLLPLLERLLQEHSSKDILMYS
jgi:preprotein translocase subunit SecA